MLYKQNTFHLVLGLLFIICSLNSSFAQRLSARVVNEKSEPLTGATVYFDGTTTGVITNLDGVFNIDIPENSSSPVLVITYLGYESITESDINNLKDVYRLKPKPVDLDEVNIYQSPFSRSAMLEVFKTYFLGSGKGAKRCKILNIDDVILYYTDSNTLKAKSSLPIVIQNNYLGYRVIFDLRIFEVKYSTQSLDDRFLLESFYAGTSLFEDISPLKNRLRTQIYNTSLNKFFKSLVEDNLKETDFILAYKGNELEHQEVFEIQPVEEDLYQISLKPEVYETENGEFIPTKIILKHFFDISNILFLEPHIRVDQYGNNRDIKNIRLIGELSSRRIANMLPTNFSVEN